jgi:predicted RNA-binding Zn ribbon-like protein
MEPMLGDRDGFRFRGGSLALDFTATLAARKREQTRELLETPRDLARWFAAAGLAVHEVNVTEHDLAAARALREALYRLALARVGGAPLPAADRRLLNRHAALATPAPRLDAAGMHWSRAETPALLAAIARAGVELLGGPLADRVRQCSGRWCAILFVDMSRSGHRKWCSMSGCGNKAKVATFRERNRAE